MRRQRAVLLAFASSPVAAWLKSPVIRSFGEQSSWAPPRQTNDVFGDKIGIAPLPTEPPRPALARMKLLARDDDVISNTCAYDEHDGEAYTCITTDESCQYRSGYIGCCEGDDCEYIHTTCIDYDAVQDGDCDLPSDYHTLCCVTSEYPACYSYLVTSGGSDDTFTMLSCAPISGSSTLLNHFPSSLTSTPSSSSSDATANTVSTTSGGSPTTTTPPPTTSSSEKDDGGTPVGAIAGGTVGGVAAVALIGIGAFFLVRRNKKNNAAKTPDSYSSPQQPMAQYASGASPPVAGPPPQGYPPSSPTKTITTGTGYASPGYGYPSSGSQPYDPHMSTYSQPPWQQHPQQFPQQYQQGGYPQQGNSYLGPGVASSYQPSSASPPAQTSPSPQGNSPSPGHAEGGQGQGQGQAPMELQATNPVGAESNRAELG